MAAQGMEDWEIAEQFNERASEQIRIGAVDMRQPHPFQVHANCPHSLNCPHNLFWASRNCKYTLHPGWTEDAAFTAKNALSKKRCNKGLKCRNGHCIYKHPVVPGPAWIEWPPRR